MSSSWLKAAFDCWRSFSDEWSSKDDSQLVDLHVLPNWFHMFLTLIVSVDGVIRLTFQFYAVNMINN